MRRFLPMYIALVFLGIGCAGGQLEQSSLNSAPETKNYEFTIKGKTSAMLESALLAKSLRVGVLDPGPAEDPDQQKSGKLFLASDKSAFILCTTSPPISAASLIMRQCGT